MELLTLEDRKPAYKAIKFDGSKSCIDGILAEFSTATQKLKAVQAITDLFAKDSETNITCVKLAWEGKPGNVELLKGKYIIKDIINPEGFVIVPNIESYTVTKTETISIDEDVEDVLPYDPATTAAKVAAKLADKKLEGLVAASMDVDTIDKVKHNPIPVVPIGTSDTLDIPIGNEG